MKKPLKTQNGASEIGQNKKGQALHLTFNYTQLVEAKSTEQNNNYISVLS